MKRFLIHVSTYWCGMDDTFRAVAEDETQLWDLAEELAYQNFQSYGLDEEIAEDQGYNPDEMSEEDWDKMWDEVDESAYYSHSIEEFDGNSTEWEAEDKNPLAAPNYKIELVRPVTQEEIDKNESRWRGYEAGWNTNAFDSPKDVVALAKEVCKARFKGNWKLKITDYSDSNLDDEVLISEL